MAPLEMDSIFDFLVCVKVQFETILEVCSNFVQCCGVVFLK